MINFYRCAEEPINHKGESTDAKHWGGAARSSDETSVMDVERRGSIRLVGITIQPVRAGR